MSVNACRSVWFRLRQFEQHFCHRCPSSSPVKFMCMLVAVSTRVVRRNWVREACAVVRCLRLAPLCSGTRTAAKGERHDLHSLLGFANESEYASWRREHERLLSNVPERRVAAACKWLRSRHLPPELLCERPSLLRVSRSTLERRMAVIEQEPESAALSGPAMLTLLSYSESLLLFVSRKGGLCAALRERAALLGSALSLPEEECLSLMHRVPCLLSQETDRLERVLRLLVDCGITRDAVLKDPWVFRHSESLMASRAARCRALGVPVRTWMLRCPEDVLERHLQLWRESRRALGTHPDTAEYLADRLSCTHIDELVHRHPRLLSIRPPKLKEVLDLLFASGYSAEQVCQSPRVLSSSANKLRRRLQWLAARKALLPSLYTLGLPEKSFERACRSMQEEHKYRQPPNGRSDDDSGDDDDDGRQQ
ncbi:mitochondrial transcription termination factor isoform X1 [Haemaphysalis longicornis]